MAAKPTREERRDERTREIVDIAARLFAEHGYAETGVAELCDAVGLGRGALYHYIESKERLLARIHERVADVLLPRGRVIVSGPGSATDKLREFGEATIATILDLPDHVWVFMHERAVVSSESRTELVAQRRAYEGQLTAILEQGRRDGDFDFVDIRLTALAWSGMHHSTYRWWRHESQYDAPAIASAFFDIFVAGIRSRDAVDGATRPTASRAAHPSR